MSLFSIKDLKTNIDEAYFSPFETRVFYYFGGTEISSYFTWILPVKNKLGEEYYYLGKLKYRRHYDRYSTPMCEMVLT